MAIGEDRVRIVGYVDKNLVEALDQVAEAMGISRSAAIEACIESGLDDIRMLKFVGLTPKRIRAVADVLKKLGKLKSGWFEVDLAKGVKGQGF